MDQSGPSRRTCGPGFGVPVPDGHVLVKIGSHKARAALARTPQTLFSWNVKGEWCHVPAGLVPAISAIRSVTVCRRLRVDLHRTLSL